MPRRRTRSPAAQGYGGTSAQSYVFEIDDDVEIRFIRPNGSTDESEALALQGMVDIKVKASASPASIKRAHEAMQKLGIDLAPPTPERIELTYLRRGVYLRNKGAVPAFESIYNGAGTEAQKVKKAKEWIAQRYGIKLPDKPTADYDPAGKLNAFGEGQRVWYRWDIPPAQMEKEMAGYDLFHRVSGDIATRLDQMLESGGEFTSTTQRLRKGINVDDTGGMSSSADIGTGGASYVFTRIKKKGTAAGFHFKIRNLSRLDAISYNTDHFGRIKLINTRNVTPAEYKQISTIGNNETILKNGLMLLEELEAVATSNAAERAKVLAVFKKHGVTKLPDGRTVEQLVK